MQSILIYIFFFNNFGYIYHFRELDGKSFRVSSYLLFISIHNYIGIIILHYLNKQ